MHTEDGEENVAVGDEGHQQSSNHIHTSKCGKDAFIQACVRTGALKKWGAVTEKVMDDIGRTKRETECVPSIDSSSQKTKDMRAYGQTCTHTCGHGGGIMQGFAHCCVAVISH